MGWFKIRDEDKVRGEVEEAVRLQIEDAIYGKMFKGVLADGSRYRVEMLDFRIDALSMNWDSFEVDD